MNRRKYEEQGYIVIEIFNMEDIIKEEYKERGKIMGMYTEFHFNSELKSNTPENVINILKYMVGDLKAEPIKLDDKLFDCSGWRFMLRCDSYSFDADTYSTLRFDDNSESYYLCIRSNLQNRENEIECFVNWIKPYLDKTEDDFLGFSRYEEVQEPTLIYM